MLSSELSIDILWPNTKCSSPTHSSSFHYGPNSLKITYLRNQDLIPWLYTRRDSLPILIQSAGSYSQHLRLIQLLHRALREEDAARRLSLRLDTLHQDAVEQWRDAADRLDGRGLIPSLAICSLAQQARRGVDVPF